MKIMTMTASLVALCLTTQVALAEAPGVPDQSLTTEKAMMRHSDLKNDALNTANNVRDKNLNTVLPEDQSNKQIFIERTANIRKAIVSRDDLSITAKNIKIITLDDGVVVLRGPVKTAEEKTRLENLAKQFSADSPVVSYLEF